MLIMKRVVSYAYSLVLGSLAFGSFMPLARAVDTTTYRPSGMFDIGSCGDINNPGMDSNSGKELLCVVNNTIGIALEIVGALIVVVIIFAGVRYMTSMGNPERVAGAKKTLVGGIIGLIIVMSAWFVVRLVGNLIAPGSVK